MANTINYAAVFNRILDEKFFVMPRTLWMENTTPGLMYEGGKEIKVPKLAMDGLGDMVGCKAPDGDLVFDYETKQLQFYRGRNFEIPGYAVDETNFALTAPNVLRVFLNEHVLPEVDKVRIMTAAQAANSFGQVKYQASTGITAANVLGLLMADIAAVQDKIGETEQLYIQISTPVKNLLESSSEITRFLNVRDFEIRSANLKIEALNEQFLIGTPSGYMKADFDLLDGRTAGQTVGGVSFGGTAPGVNWIISARRAVDAIARPYVDKVITPDINQDGYCWKVMFHIYHGVWGYENKGDGLLANLDTTLGSLTVTSAAISGVSGKSTIGVNATNKEDAILVYIVDSAATTVTQGTALTGWAPLPADGIVTAANGKVITVALAGKESLLPLASGYATVVAN